MLQYIARRVLQFIPVFLGVTLILFLMTTLLGDPIRLSFGERAITRPYTRSCKSFTASTSRGTCSTSSTSMTFCTGTWVSASSRARA